MAHEKPVSMRKLTVLGEENLPKTGGFLILPNLLRYVDLMRLEKLLDGRSFVYLVEQGAALAPEVRAHLEKEHVHALAVLPDEVHTDSYRRAVSAEIEKNAIVVYLPAQAATVNAALTTVPGARLDFLLKADVPVVPLYVQPASTIALDIGAAPAADDVTMAFGPVLDGEDLTLPAYQESLFRLAEQCFASHPSLNVHLAYALIQGFKRHGTRNRVIDGKDDRDLPYDRVLAAAIALSKSIAAETNKKRVGIILPPGIGGLIANVAVLLAGKIPVNLNFTAGRAAIEHAIKAADIDRFITVDLFVRKMQSFPWPPMRQLLLIERVLPLLKKRISTWFILSKILPAPLLALVLGVPRRGGDKEALLLFTSGSSGNPKGVALTHRNIMANVIQFSSRLGLTSNDAILGSLPLFHSFGCTVTLWYPVISGLNLITYPTPLETKKLAELIERHRISLLISTPTFLRGYLRGVNREALASLKLCVTGAEKLPPTVAEAFEAKFGKRVYEGYGLTETSPVSNVNLPDPVPLGGEAEGFAWLPSHRPGSTGQLMPGLAVRITDPDSQEPQSLHQSGMIWFKGANVFGGYLNDPKRSAEVLDPEGWFRTGDIGRVDMDGFLYIEGRLSRFSKIGGEMVPHETVEDALNKALGLENESVRKIAVVGVPDPEKGEALILLTALPGGAENQEILDLRYRLLDKGMPALWIPKKMVRVSDIPVLASGKLDVQACEKIAKERA